MPRRPTQVCNVQYKPRPSPLVTPRPKNLRHVLSEAPRVAWGISAAEPLMVFASHYVREGLWGWGMHLELQIGLLLHGSVQRFYLDHTRTLQPGDLWLCGVYEPHAWQLLTPSAQWLVLVMLPELPASFDFDRHATIDWLAPFALAPSRRPRIGQEMRGQILTMGQRMLEQVYDPPVHHAVQLRLDVMQLLLLASANLTASRQPHRRPSANFDRIRTAVTLATTQRRFLAVSQAASACGMQTRRFAQLFNETMGIGFAEFALRRRLHGAAISLRRDDAPIKAVAGTWGFTDAAHFCHCFKKLFHCTPGAYRRQ